MSMQLSFGYNVMSPVVAKMVSDHIIKHAKLKEIYYRDSQAPDRQSAAYSIMMNYLHNNHAGCPDLTSDVVTELRRQFPDTATAVEDEFRDWLNDW